MTNTNQLFEVKSQLAKLLAAENIHIRHVPGAKTASFDIKSRVLNLPVWQNISNDLYDMLVVHEVGHALDTPFQGWIEAIKNITKNVYGKENPAAEAAVKDFLNVVEDARIDKRQKRRYPGSRRNYTVGYQELFTRDFFGIVGKDINSLSFIDRANIYFKGGYIFNIKFTPEERVFIKKMDAAETFDEVVDLTEQIFAYAKKQGQEMTQTVKHGKMFIEDEDGDETAWMESDDENLDSAEDWDDVSDMFSVGDEASDEDGDGADLDQDDSEIDADDIEGSKTGEDGEGDLDEDDDERGTVGDSEIGGENEDQDFVPEVATEEAARHNLEKIVLDKDLNYVYLSVPKFKLEGIVDDYKTVMKRFDEDLPISRGRYGWYSGAYRDILSVEEARAKFAEWRARERDSISFMVKEFEMRKSADLYMRTSIAKTGVIDTNKLHSYRYNDDLFRRHAVVSKGKNHGFVMLLDWSGSMATDLISTIKQLLSLVLFCRQVQVPFEVYYFRNTEDFDFNDGLSSAGHSYREVYKIDQKRQATQYDYKENSLEFSTFKLCNILSSRMNNTTLNHAMSNLWCSAYRMLQRDALGSTPLNQAILALEHIVNDFRVKNKVQIVNTIVLTDGGSDPIQGIHNMDTQEMHSYKNRFILTDDVTKKTYYFEGYPGGWGMDGTSAMLKILRDRTGCNLIGFYQYSGHYNGLGSLIDWTILEKKETKDFWKKNNYLPCNSKGFDEYFILDARSAQQNLEQPLNVNSTMTKRTMLNEFIKYSGKNAVNRVLLSRFVEHIASEKKKAA